MKSKDFDIFKNKYIANSKTKSTHEAVLEVYAFILENENSDSDYWTVGGGNNRLVMILEYQTQEADWIELDSDLDNWTTGQLEIFTLCITSGRGIFDKPGSSAVHYDESGIEYSYKYADGESTINRRISLLYKLIQISEESERRFNEIITHIYENSEIFREATDLPFQIINSIATSMDFYKSDRIEDEFIANLKYALQKALS